MIRLNVSLLQTQSISMTPAAASCIDLAMLLALAGLAEGLVLQYYFLVFRSSSHARSRLEVRSTICYQKRCYSPAFLRFTEHVLGRVTLECCKYAIYPACSECMVRAVDGIGQGPAYDVIADMTGQLR